MNLFIVKLGVSSQFLKLMTNKNYQYNIILYRHHYYQEHLIKQYKTLDRRAVIHFSKSRRQAMFCWPCSSSEGESDPLIEVRLYL